MNQEKIDIESLLKQGQTIQIKPQGYSMYPMFIPGRDEAIIQGAEPSKLKKGDVILYRREQGILVLHRICRIKHNTFYLVGDNQHEIEGPLYPEQVKGILIGFIRNGKYRSVKNPVYILASRIWLFVLPIRPVLAKVAAIIKRLFKGSGEKL